LLSRIDTALEAIEAGKDRAKKPEPDAKLLAQLAEACKKHSMVKVDEIIAQLDAHSYEEGGGLIEWLKEMSDEMEYDSMTERLSQDI
jgi:L-lactate utilization protein LutB